jgi:penicillin-binding protein 1B
MDLSGMAGRFVRTRVFKGFLVAVAVLAVVCVSILGFYYHRYNEILDQRLNGHVFENTAKIYDSSGNLITNLSGEGRSKRRLVAFKDIPRVLIDAVTAGEDKKFFQHHGLDVKRIVGAFVWNIREKKGLQGGSTITQQLARSFFLTRERTLRRKLSEAAIAVMLEHRLTKEQIFTMYANEVYLGEHGLFAIHGFSEAAHAFFGKELGDLTLPEAATLAAIIPAPNAFSPDSHPDRAVLRRNQILNEMREMDSIKDADYQSARQAGLEIAPPDADVAQTAYFVDFTRQELSKNHSEEEVRFGGYSVYTTLDLDLQRAAVEAVEKGLEETNKELAAAEMKDKKDKKNRVSAEQAGSRPEAALIALDPHTGEIKAMVGGSDYAATQYNRISAAFRQPGSVFKPFVYAAALESAYSMDSSAGQVLPASQSSFTADIASPSIEDRLITPVTRILDAPRTFMYGNEVYEPNNFKGGFGGLVSLRIALQKSLNSAAVQVAERIGYSRVARFAQRMGLNDRIRGYPSVALGAFEVTPVELAGAYTAFANEGKRIDPHVIRRIQGGGGAHVQTPKYKPVEVIHPQLAFLMTYLMEGVIDRGTGAKVRTRGFTLPAAGKTGTSHDGWFAGYTRNLLVIAWVGFDDNRDLGLEGSRSALPIWAEFMLKAYKIHPPSQRMDFPAPTGIEFVSIDPQSMLRATSDCPETYQEAFIAGTAPVDFCPLHSVHVATDANEPSPDGIAPIGKTVPGTTSDTLRAKPTADH